VVLTFIIITSAGDDSPGRGIVFGRVCTFILLLVNNLQVSSERISMEFFRGVWGGTKITPLNFGIDDDHVDFHKNMHRSGTVE